MTNVIFLSSLILVVFILNDFEAVTLNVYKQNIKGMLYKVFDGKNYIDVKNKVIKEDAALMTYDRSYLTEFNNRLLDTRYSLDNFILRFFYKECNSLIVEIQKTIAEDYKIPLPKE